jgi:transcriptional regulator with XRE-family HTH domain
VSNLTCDFAALPAHISFVARKQSDALDRLDDFGHVIRALVNASHFVNRTEFCRSIKVDPPNFYRYEQGRSSPSLEQLEEWAGALGCDPAALVPGSRFSAVELARLRADADPALQWAADQAQLSEHERRRLFDVRLIVGPMEREQLLVLAMRIRRNAIDAHRSDGPTPEIFSGPETSPPTVEQVEERLAHTRGRSKVTPLASRRRKPSR